MNVQANEFDRRYAVEIYWPQKDVPFPKVKAMYQKMLTAETNGKEGAKKTTGPANGS